MINTRPEKKLNFELSGGLGNQLFQYFAGKHLESTSPVSYSVAPSQMQRVRTGILEFHVGEILLSVRKEKSAVFNFFYRVFRRLLRSSRTFRSLALTYFGIYQSQGIGYAENLREINRIKTIYGYFQSYLYVPQVINEIGLQLKNPSRDVLNLLKELSEVDPIIIHIRGGDYRELMKSIGILSSDSIGEL